VNIDFGSYHHSGSHTGYVANAGAGVKIFLTNHVALRPEVRVIAGSAGSSVSKPFSAELKFSMGLGYHW
jgi:hypothetical protein